MSLASAGQKAVHHFYLNCLALRSLHPVHGEHPRVFHSILGCFGLVVENIEIVDPGTVVRTAGREHEVVTLNQVPPEPQMAKFWKCFSINIPEKIPPKISGTANLRPDTLQIHPSAPTFESVPPQLSVVQPNKGKQSRPQNDSKKNMCFNNFQQLRIKKNKDRKEAFRASDWSK